MTKVHQQEETEEDAETEKEGEEENLSVSQVRTFAFRVNISIELTNLSSTLACRRKLRISSGFCRKTKREVTLTLEKYEIRPKFEFSSE